METEVVVTSEPAVTTPTGGRWLQVVTVVAMVAAAAQVVTLAWIVAARLTYPYDLEWMEGGQLYHAHRVLRGQPLYGPPDGGFVPFAYGPGHAWLLAAAGRVFGLDYTIGRLVSVACIAVACAVLFREVWRHAGRGAAGAALGLVAVGTIAAGFPGSGGWYDVVRNDSLAIALPVTAAALVVDPGRLASRRRAAAIAALLAAAVLTRQTDLAFAAWIALFVLATDRRAGVRICLLTAALVGGVTLALQLASHGWYLTWLTVPSRHELDIRAVGSAAKVVLPDAPYLVLVPALAVVLVRRRWISRRGVLWLGMLAAAVPASLVPYLKVGRYLNDLVPLFVLAGPVTLILALDLVHGFDRAPGPAGPRRAATARLVMATGAAVLLVGLHYGPGPYVPDAAQRRAVDRLDVHVAALDGGVLSPDNPFLAVRNGHDGVQAHMVAHNDAYDAGLDGTEIERYVADSPARWVLVDRLDAAVVARADWFVTEPGTTPGATATLTGRSTAPTLTLRRVDRRDRRVVFDFEDPAAPGWEATGDAFPALSVALDDAPPGTRNARGERLASSGGDPPDDRAEGTLTSPPFTLTGSHVGLLVGGGPGPDTRVEIVVDGTTVARIYGDGAAGLRYVGVDVSGWQGRQARIRLVDEAHGPAGYILTDQVETFSLASARS